MKTAYIVKGYRTAVGKSKKGVFRFKRADELAAETIKYMMSKLPEFDVKRIDDVIVGNAMPEGSQGLNMARIISLIGLDTVDVPGVTVNRFCSSGLETIGMAVAKIQSGMAECIIAGGTESMSSVPMTGIKPELKYNLVNAGNSSQTSDGAAFVMVMSEEMVKELGIEPEARMVSYAAAGVPPRIMGIGPVAAIPKALKQAGLQQNDVELIELNEAFASQSLAVIRELDLNPDIINVNGGAIALGHPLGCTGAKLSVQLFDEMRKREMKNKYGMVTMCVGTGQGAAGIFEFLN
jgi:acetyl-CoA acetyltransferase